MANEKISKKEAEEIKKVFEYDFLVFILFGVHQVGYVRCLLCNRSIECADVILCRNYLPLGGGYSLLERVPSVDTSGTVILRFDPAICGGSCDGSEFTGSELPDSGSVFDGLDPRINSTDLRVLRRVLLLHRCHTRL